nr:SLATT domain-containing protein [Chloroflexota bacterium]
MATTVALTNTRLLMEGWEGFMEVNRKDVLNIWYKRVSKTQRAHYLSAGHFGRRSYGLGIPVIALTTFVGTSLFATLQTGPEPWLQVLVGLASVLAAVLASLQTFLGYAERAEKHRVAGAKYGALGRELEALL